MFDICLGTDVNLCTCGLNLESNTETYSGWTKCVYIQCNKLKIVLLFFFSELMHLRSTLETAKQELKTVRDLSEAKDVRIRELEKRIEYLEESFEIRLKEAETAKNQSSDKISCVSLKFG